MIEVEHLPTVDIEPDQNEKPAKSSKAKKPGGTFHSMGLSRPIVNAIERKGYKLATPIQRKCIPTIMSGRDVVAMARTGSGKSAAFLLPLIDRLKIRQPKSDIRALIVSPTRELATQTLKFTREFTKFTNLVSKLIIGGESINHDFETITSSPDILIATPGRLAHVLVEMKRKLDCVEIVVFDEADRLFEPGFKEMEQVNEICQRLNDSKQTLLFSATIPQRLAEFAKAGLRNPSFVRLDVEASLSETLKSIHLHCNQQDKFATLIYLLKNFVKREQMTVVFMPTRHHIEYSKMLLDNSNINCSYVYSSMDPEARRINIDKFTKKHCRVMLVTDIAARGIDIPLLDIVINFNFPFKPKLYIHRVGRVARAGRFGCAISLISHDETAYLHALHMFFDLPVTTASQISSEANTPTDLTNLPDKVLGTVPQGILDEENDILKRWHQHDDDLQAMVRVCDNAMKPYLKTREPPAFNSVKATKDMCRKVIGHHPIFNIITTDGSIQETTSIVQDSADQLNLLDRIKSYKPQATIFEVGHIKGIQRTEAFEVMQKKRSYHDKVAKDRLDKSNDDPNQDETTHVSEDDEPAPKKAPIFKAGKFYLKYQPDDYVREKGLELDKNTFNNEIKMATMDLVADDENRMKSQRHQTIWDRKKKKYVQASSLDSEKKSKKIRTESGAYISASYSSGLYEKWKSSSKVEQRFSDNDDDNDDDAGNTNSRPNKSKRPNNNRRPNNDEKKHISLDQLRAKLKPSRTRKRELKNPDEILKDRGIREKREAILRIKTMRKAERNAQRNAKGDNKGDTKGYSKGNTKGRGAKGNTRRNTKDNSKGNTKSFAKGNTRGKTMGHAKGKTTGNGRRTSKEFSKGKTNKGNNSRRNSQKR